MQVCHCVMCLGGLESKEAMFVACAILSKIQFDICTTEQKGIVAHWGK